MNTKTVFFVGLFGAVIGCAATQAAQVHYASAQYEPGEVHECVRANIGGMSAVDSLDSNAVVIPPGWRAVGGAGQSVVLCR